SRRAPADPARDAVATARRGGHRRLLRGVAGVGGGRGGDRHRHRGDLHRRVGLAHRRGRGRGHRGGAREGAGVSTVATPSPDLVRPTRLRTYSTAWWGVITVIATEGMIFALLISSYFFLRAASKQWPPPGVELPDLKLSLPFSFVLWGSSIPIFWAEHAIRRGRQ